MRGSQEEAGRLVAQVVSASGGSVYGRVRLQKMFYLLDRIGLGSELDYEYHYYGPYSAELTEQIKDAVAFGFIEETPARRASDGVPYSVFGRPTVELGESLGALDRRTSERALVRMQGESATVLELAATIDWLQTREEVPDWQRELFRRKGAKAESGRVDRALGLLRIAHLRLTAPPPAFELISYRGGEVDLAAQAASRGPYDRSRRRRHPSGCR